MKWVWKSLEMGRQNIRNGLWSVREIQVQVKHTIIEASARKNIRKWVWESSEMGCQNIRNGFWFVRKIQVQMKHTIIEASARKTAGNGCGKRQKWVVKHQKWALVWRRNPSTNETHHYRNMCKYNSGNDLKTMRKVTHRRPK